MKSNKIGEIWNSANRLLSDFISLLLSKNFATIATLRDFSPLYHLKGLCHKYFNNNYYHKEIICLTNRIFTVFSLGIGDLILACKW